MRVHILVLDYNGKLLLEECMPSIVAASQAYPGDCRVTVVDNGSTNDSIDFLEKNFPDVIVHRAKANLILSSFNPAVEELDDDIVILLNNDVKVEPDFIEPLMENFEGQDDVFFVGSKCYTFDKAIYEGTRSRIQMKWGMPRSQARYPGYEQDIDRKGYTMQAGFGAFSREKFLALGGYDEMFVPGTSEDMDIFYRALRRGWKAVYEPRSVIYHKSQASMKRSFGSRYGQDVLTSRNLYLFTWKNISDRRLLFQHVLFLVPWLVWYALHGRFGRVVGFFKAIPRLPKALRRRSEVQPTFVKTDREVLAVEL